ncbi:DUF3048 domain-containing protein [Streptomyces sp. ACA25]|uniref:DUF3048 domain-containing protein n=1 Tax=Streptomyces sp. ACA25 TaxID=3022596 RepID=UPI00230703F2|nr:DUF3048 domain-containing protein [Streptomyces sp. ACA25]MDB1086621.1 DUF3048 domain-containing protein [Streptomyces sp. ACA25]
MTVSGHRGRRVRALAVLGAALLTLSVGCQVEDNGAPDGQHPFTGGAPASGPVLAVKIDNVRAARPQTGLDQADLVYVEQVESGLSRLLAVYSGSLPEHIGPVRSAREADLELLEQFGSPALGYSGAQSALLPDIAAAPLYPVAPENAPGAFERRPQRAAPHNLYLDPTAVLAAAPDADPPQDIGFRFGDAPEGGEPTPEYSVGFPNADFSFTWSGQEDRWLIGMDGTAALTEQGDRLTAATVVVQHVLIRPSELQDRWGNVTPYSETVGSGTAQVLRDGQAFQATWERPDAGGGTEFTDPDGERLPFSEGPVWVVLAPAE